MTLVKPRRKQSSQLRIIGGEYRGRKLNFPDIQGLRPTPDRIRETLFNWLQFDIIGSHCLDLFAGSGALGFEALSRGASSVTFIDEHTEVISTIKSNIKILGTSNIVCCKADALDYLDHPSHRNKFNIVFCDPPFHQGFLPKVVDALTSAILQPGALIYLEMEKGLIIPQLPENWRLHREKTAGQIHAMLFVAESG